MAGNLKSFAPGWGPNRPGVNPVPSIPKKAGKTLLKGGEIRIIGTL